jgi:hypothetical protein
MPLALALVTAGLCWTAAAGAVSDPGLVVIPRPAAGTSLSYFKLLLHPGSKRQAGTLELHNPTGRTARVALAAVAGQTLDTLGSAYAPPGSKANGPTRWLRVARQRVTLTPGATVAVPVSVAVPREALPGDYLTGVSIEALDQRQSVARRGVSIASVERYAIGVETSLPGPRHPAIKFIGARLRRQPAGLTFLLDAHNTGNVILQGVHGGVRITRARHTILHRLIEPGTFVTDTRIAYPVPAFGRLPPRGRATV